MSSLTTADSSMEEEFFDTRLSLEIGETSCPPPPPQQVRQTTTTTVRLFGEIISPPASQQVDRGGGPDHHPAAGWKKRSSPGSRQGSKKARTTTTVQQTEDDRRSASDGAGSISRKKLRLTGAQATMLDDTFRAHNILSHAQKHDLARRVGLSARQVEVWFQNRRARMKLKQTEVDCELLRRWCDRLTDENARLRRDLAEVSGPGVVAVCPS